MKGERNMKKLVSSLLVCTIAVMMSFSSLSVVQAKQQTHEEFLQEVEIKLKNAGEYAFGNENFTVDNSVYFLNYIRSGAQIDETEKEQFLSNLKNNLETNNKVFITENVCEKDENGQWQEVQKFREDIGAYGAIILILQELGLDPQNFEGHNIQELLESMDPSESNTNPYYYRLAVEAATFEYKIKLVDQFINDYYVLGKGLDYYGFGCDNTCVFLTSLATVKDNYSQYVNDAKTLIQTYEKENGLSYETEYNASSDSTACGMMAMAAVGDVDKAYEYYCQLIGNFETDTSGVFGNKNNQVQNTTSTVNAAVALYYFKELIKNEDHIYTVVNRQEPTCDHEGKEDKECMICGHSISTVLEHLEHQYVVTVVAPTADAQGYTLHKCSLCGNEYKDQFTAATQNSKIQSVDTSDPTDITFYVSAAVISGMYIIFVIRKKAEWK